MIAGTRLLWGQPSKAKVTSHKNVASMGLYTLVSAGFFWLSVYADAE